MTQSVIYPENRLQNTALAERPQERMIRMGAGALSDTELLAMLLRSGTRGMDVLSLAGKLIKEAGSLSQLVEWELSDFRRFKGVGPIKALQIVTTMEIARRVMTQRKGLSPVLNQANLVASYMRPTTHGLSVEKFWVLALNRRNRLIKCMEVSSGTATAALAHPREVFRDAIKLSATAIICVHNHPSGDPSPSAADIKITRQLREAARTVDIEFHDHVILGHSDADPTS